MATGCTPSPSSSESTSTAAAAQAVLDAGTFSFIVEMGSGGAGAGTDDELSARGRVDLAAGRAAYSPFVDATGSGEVRVSGSRLFLTAGDGIWQVSTLGDDADELLEAMPFSGSPVLAIRSLADSADAGRPVEVAGQEGQSCTDHDGGDGVPYTACVSGGLLRWVRYVGEGDSGVRTIQLDEIGEPVEVAVPTEGVSEFGDGGVSGPGLSTEEPNGGSRPTPSEIPTGGTS